MSALSRLLMNEQTNNVFSYRTYALLPRQRGKKFGFGAHVRSQKPALGHDDSSHGGLLLSYRPLLKSDASLITPIGDGAVLRRGYLHPIKAESPRNDALGKPDPHSHARSARPDACDVRVMNSNDLPTRCIKPTDAGKRRRAGS